MNKSATSPSNEHSENPANGPDDLELVSMCQQGDTGAFNELITRYRQRCFAMIFHMVRNEEDAWDLTQDGFVRAWRNLKGFRGQSSFYTWLYRVMANVGLDWLRKKRVRGDGEFDDTVALRSIETSAPTAPKAIADPTERIVRGEVRARIDAAIEKLTPEHRTAIVLREIEGLDYQEIADAMECSIGTVMSRLFYARKKLQTQLQDVYEQL